MQQKDFNRRRNSKNKIFIGSNDLVDGTPILDIKPYLPRHDAINSANSGWLEEIEAEHATPAVYKVQISELANAKLLWLRERNVTFIDRAVEILERDPTPHKTRRIAKMPNGKFRIGCASWRILFSVLDKQVLIEDVFSAYKKDDLQADMDSNLSDIQIHIDFYKLWPSSPKVFIPALKGCFG